MAYRQIGPEETIDQLINRIVFRWEELPLPCKKEENCLKKASQGIPVKLCPACRDSIILYKARQTIGFVVDNEIDHSLINIVSW